MTDAVYAPNIYPSVNITTAPPFESSEEFSSSNAVGISMPSTPAENSRWATPLSSPSRPEDDSPDESKPIPFQSDSHQIPDTTHYYGNTLAGTECYSQQQEITFPPQTTYDPSPTSNYDPYCVPSQSSGMFWGQSSRSYSGASDLINNDTLEAASPMLVAPVDNLKVPPSPYVSSTVPAYSQNGVYMQGTNYYTQPHNSDLPLDPHPNHLSLNGSTKTGKSKSKKNTNQQALMEMYTQANQPVLLTPTGRISKAKTARYRKQVMQANAARLQTIDPKSANSFVPCATTAPYHNTSTTNPTALPGYPGSTPPAYVAHSGEMASQGSSNAIAQPANMTYWDPAYNYYYPYNMNGTSTTPSTVEATANSNAVTYPNDGSYPYIYDQYPNGTVSYPANTNFPLARYPTDVTPSLSLAPSTNLSNDSLSLPTEPSSYITSSSFDVASYEATPLSQSATTITNEPSSISGDLSQQSTIEIPETPEICLSEQFMTSQDEQSYPSSTLVGSNVSKITPSSYSPSLFYNPFVTTKAFGKQDKSVVHSQCLAIMARLDANPSVRFLWAPEEGTSISARGRCRNMCLASINKNLKRYRTTHQFAQDLRRVIDNVLMHHPFGHPLREKVQRVWNMIVGIFAEMSLPYHVPLQQLEIRTVLPMLFFCSPAVEDLKYNSQVVSQKICKRLGRRGGSPRPFWPADWHRASLQPITISKVVSQTLYNPPCCVSCCSYSAKTFEQACNQVATSMSCGNGSFSTPLHSSSSNVHAGTDSTRCNHRVFKIPASRSASLVGQSCFAPSTSNPRRVPICDNCHAECSLIKPQPDHPRKRVRVNIVKDTLSDGSDAFTTVASSASTTQPSSPGLESQMLPSTGTSVAGELSLGRLDSIICDLSTQDQDDLPPVYPHKKRKHVDTRPSRATVRSSRLRST